MDICWFPPLETTSGSKQVLPNTPGSKSDCSNFALLGSCSISMVDKVGYRLRAGLGVRGQLNPESNGWRNIDDGRGQSSRERVASKAFDAYDGSGSAEGERGKQCI